MYIDIVDKDGLLEKEGEIAQLFLSSYGKPLSLEEWRWFYIDNPVGAPVVSLFYKEEQLLGHYAVLPTLLSFRGESIIAYRSMTTMVHPEGRGCGLFTDLAKRVYSILEKLEASMVYGFPNGNSAPGFIRNLGWSLESPDRVFDFSGDEILHNNELQSALTARYDIEWDVRDPMQLKWRHSMPGARVQSMPGLVIKEYQGVLCILHIDKFGVDSIKTDCKYRVLLPERFLDKFAWKESVFDYQFGYRIFDDKYRGFKFRRELIMSDVF